MAGIFGGSKNSNSTPRYTQINLQTSAQGLCIPIGWGQFRAGTNLIWYNDFKSTPVKQKGGKGGSGGSGQTYDYSAAVIMALCEGGSAGIQGINQVWAGRAITTLTNIGLGLYTGTQTQTAWPYVTTTHPTQALAYAGTAYVYTSKYALGTSPDLPSHNFEIIGNLSGTMPYGSLVDANPGDIIPDFLTNIYYGSGLPSAAIGTSIANYKAYCQVYNLFMSPYLHQQEQALTTIGRWATVTNSFIFWSGAEIKFVPLGTETKTFNGATYTANNSPIYNLTYDDFQWDTKTGQGPIEVTRIDPLDGYNQVQLDISDRSNAYNSTPVTWKDQTSCDQNGQLQANTISAPEVCDMNIGSIMAALIGKRSVYIRNHYKFVLDYTFVLLEPGDIVTVSDPNIGLIKFPVRILTVDEDEKGMLAFLAEEFPYGIGQTTVYAGTASSSSAPINVLVAPPNVNTPAIFEPNAALTGGVPQVWLQVSGGANWGGADAYVSFDGGTTYSEIGRFTGTAIQGVLTAALASHADPDTTNTLAVNLIESLSILPATAVHADADAFRTLCLVDTELVAYGSAASGTGAYGFNLTYLRRGLYGTTIAAHSIGGNFSRVDPQTTLQYALPAAYIGATLYFKFLSFNQFGNMQQDISTATAYSYTTSGAGYFIAAPTGVTLTASRTTQSDGTTLINMATTWTASTGPIVGGYHVQVSTDGGTTFGPGITVGSNVTSYTITPALANTNYQVRVNAVSTTGINLSTWANSLTVNSGALVASVPAAPIGVTTTASGSNALVSYTLETDPTISSYQIWRAPGTSSFSSAVLVQSNGLSSSWTDTTTAPSTQYTYYIEAINAAGNSAPSLGATVTTGVFGLGSPFDVSMSYVGTPPGSNTRFYRLVLGRAITLPVNLTGSQAKCRVATTNTFVFTILQNGASIGTVNFGSGATSATFVFVAAVTFVAGDILEIDGPATADATMVDVSITLIGTR